VSLHSSGRVVVGGSPLTLLRLSERGAAIVGAIGAGQRPPRDPAAVTLIERLVDIGAVVSTSEAGDPRLAGTVDVVVPVRDDVPGLEATLRTLRSGGAPAASLDVTVVDDGSVDAAAVAAVAGTFGATVVRHEHALGPAAARNSGVGAGSAAWIGFVDAGVEVPSDWLTTLGRHAVADRVAAVAPRVVSPPGPTALERYEAAASPLDLGARPGPIRPGSRIGYVPTATLLVRRRAFEDIGGFDAELRFGEDVDLVWRLVAGGWRCRFVGDEVAVRHPPRRTWSALMRQRFRYGTSAAGLDARHPGAVAPLVTSRWTAAVCGLGIAGHPLLALGTASVSAALLARKLPVDDAASTAVRLVARGHLGGARRLAAAAVRPWWPVTVLAACSSRRARRLLPLLVVPPLFEWRERRPDLGAVRWIAARLADDVAYGTGVWVGALRSRSLGALLPTVTEWPGRIDRSRPTRQN
jgi:mycofactocin system glycosyltransferase